MSKSCNTKVNRTLSAMAIELKDLPDDKQQRLHKLINDERDGYVFDWLGEVAVYRRFVLDA